MQNSKIEWTDHTFNPWWGCQRVSDGCIHCYAETLANRYGHAVWGPAKTTQRRAMSENYWRQPLRWNEAVRKAGQRARVFCASMADVFEDHPQVVEWRERLWWLIGLTPRLDWLLLTKRPENIARMMPVRWGCDPGRGSFDDASLMPLNVWIGTSVEDQQRANERIPHLLRVPARVRFLSCEPLRGPVNIEPWLFEDDGPGYRQGVRLNSIHWCIVGGESGHGARPMHPDWARSLRDQAAAAGVAYFFKQWGEYGPWPEGVPFNERTAVFQWPTTYYNDDKQHFDQRYEPHYRVGKHAAGRLLDGRTHDDYPA